MYEIDRCTFIAYQWDALFHLKDIMTPLPRPLEEYTLVSSPTDPMSMKECSHHFRAW